jgi:hypothetical protein
VLVVAFQEVLEVLLMFGDLTRDGPCLFSQVLLLLELAFIDLCLGDEFLFGLSVVVDAWRLLSSLCYLLLQAGDLAL